MPVEQPTTAHTVFEGPGHSASVSFIRTVRLVPTRASAAEVLAQVAASEELQQLAEVVMGRLEDFDLMPSSVALSKARQVRQQLLDPAERARLETVRRYARSDNGAPFPDPPLRPPEGRPVNTGLDGWAPDHENAVVV